MHEHELESPTKHGDMRLGEEWHDVARCAGGLELMGSS
uniref:Uncharacterized protein n=1 Tax=Fagus sylvatica TaxID=28930 RepID=A0A2N9EK75_FAGSY